MPILSKLKCLGHPPIPPYPPGNVLTVTDPDGAVTTFAYDGRNRQLSATRNGVTQSRTYTAAGELDTTTDALGRTMDYAYNAP